MDIDKANIVDVPYMHRLINHFAEKGEMLARPLSEIYENLRDFSVAKEGDELVACVSFHVCWEDLAEIKSLAVTETSQTSGIGSRLVEACLEEARKLGIPTIFCLTYKPSFFGRFGFRQVDRAELPRKVWGECQRCPKFPNCDETAMVLHLDGETKPEESQPGEHTISSQYVFQGRGVNVRVDKVVKASGRQTTREVVERTDAVVIVPIDAEGRVLLVRQHRHAVGQALLEVPAGVLNEGESAEDCARRELQEEVGFLPQNLTALGGFYSAPGFCSEYLHLFKATDLVPSRLYAEDTADIEVVPVSLSQIPDFIASGKIQDAKSVAGLLRVFSTWASE